MKYTSLSGDVSFAKKMTREQCVAPFYIRFPKKKKVCNVSLPTDALMKFV